MVLFLPIPEISMIDKTSPMKEGTPGEAPKWDLESVKARLGPVLPVPLKNPPGREVTATVRLNGWKKVLVRITDE
jgi:hypothetical protein